MAKTIYITVTEKVTLTRTHVHCCEVDDNFDEANEDLVELIYAGDTDAREIEYEEDDADCIHLALSTEDEIAEFNATAP